MTGAEFAVMVVAIGIGVMCRVLFMGKPSRANGQGSGAPGQPVVTVAVRGPVMPVPSLMDAYAALPPHCQQVLGR